MVYYILVPIGVGLLAVLFAAFLINDVLRRDTGTPSMQKIANAIFSGATAFLNRQYRTIALLAVVAAVLVAAALALLGQGTAADRFNLAWHTALAFLVGALCSGISGYTGMYVAVKSNSRTASAARRSLGEALVVALRGGAVSGFLVVALSILGVSLLFTAFGGLSSPATTPSLIVGYAFGASFVALFAQLGGGIYTKAADLGADLVGKVEVGIPEDDPRNPAVIADNVGDNVGDCAGMGSDVYESYVVIGVASIILAALLLQAQSNFFFKDSSLLYFPLLVGAMGIVGSIVGSLVVNPSLGNRLKPMRVLDLAFIVAGILIIILTGAIAFTLFPYSIAQSTLIATITGVVLVIVI